MDSLRYILIMPIVFWVKFLPSVKYTEAELSEMLEGPHKSSAFGRLFLVRHFRAIKLNDLINAHYDTWAKFGYLPVNANHDYKIAKAIWNGDL